MGHAAKVGAARPSGTGVVDHGRSMRRLRDQEMIARPLGDIDDGIGCHDHGTAERPGSILDGPPGAHPSARPFHPQGGVWETLDADGTGQIAGPIDVVAALEAAQVLPGIEGDALRLRTHSNALPHRILQLEHEPDRAIGEHARVAEVLRNDEMPVAPESTAAAATALPARSEVAPTTVLPVLL